MAVEIPLLHGIRNFVHLPPAPPEEPVTQAQSIFGHFNPNEHAALVAIPGKDKYKDREHEMIYSIAQKGDNPLSSIARSLDTSEGAVPVSMIAEETGQPVDTVTDELNYLGTGGFITLRKEDRADNKEIVVFVGPPPSPRSA